MSGKVDTVDKVRVSGTKFQIGALVVLYHSESTYKGHRRTAATVAVEPAKSCYMAERV